MKTGHFRLFIVPFILILLLAGCKKEAVLDGESSLFKDYSNLESALSAVPYHPNDGFNKRLGDFTSDYGWNFDLSNIPDGVYEACSVPDKYAYVHYLRLEIKDHQFENVYYNEYMEFEFGSGNEGKRDSEAYHNQMLAYGVDADLREAYPLMEKELLESQDPMKVDGITGASLAVQRFRILIMKALYEQENNVILNKKPYDLGDSVEFTF